MQKDYRNVMPTQPVILAALVLLALAGRADTVTLKNGSRLEGVVIQETAEEVVLQLGTGSTTLRRSAVASVARADAEENSALSARWKQKYAVRPPLRLTPALQALGAEFAKLGALRGEALRAREALADLAAREGGGQAELEEVRTQLLQVEVQIGEALKVLQAHPAGANLTVAQLQARQASALAYNTLVSSNTVLRVRWERLREAREAGRKDGDAAGLQMSAYREALPLFAARFEAERKKPAGDPDAADRREYLEAMGSQLAEYLRDFPATEVPVTRMGDGVAVTALINGEYPARLQVDTGASLVTVSEAFLRRLQVDPATLPEAEFTLADGRKVTGRSMTFQTLAVGGAQAGNVEVGVLPDKPGEQLDGLLGMSFLRHFSVSLDGASGKLTLCPLQAKPGP